MAHHQPIALPPFPATGDSAHSPSASHISHTLGMQHPVRMQHPTMTHNTNSTTLPGSSAAGHFGAPGLGGPPPSYFGYPHAGASTLNGLPGGVGFGGSGVPMRSGAGAAAATAGMTGQAPPTLPTSVINLANSSDVVIGPMTQYQGSVTIYQYMDATFDAMSMAPPAMPPQLSSDGGGGGGAAGGGGGRGGGPRRGTVRGSEGVCVCSLCVCVCEGVCGIRKTSFL